MARQNGKLIFLSDIHAGMPANELARRRSLMDQAFAAFGDDPATIVPLFGDSMEGPFVPADARPESLLSDRVASFARGFMERLGFFLEMIDRCDVLFSDKVGERLVFLVCADRAENLDLIRGAIAQERRLLDELGVDPREIDIERGMIRIPVDVPEDDSASALA
ncbi:MAG TPA: hypothetical protein VL500_02585 [Candidatus Eisenbacteria bacterium]|nr:hypothetical protein [Candidatus Eisenbacteria bacterium]